MKKITSKDVAAMAGVSQSTVSLILNNSKAISFSEETKEKVYEAARLLSYKIPSQKTQLPQSCENIIAILVPTLTNQYYTELMAAIEHNANEMGFTVLFCNTSRNKETEKYYLELFEKIGVEGIIYTFIPSFPHFVDRISEKIPMVLIGEKQSGMSISSIELSHVRAGNLLAEHLISLGHRHFAFLSTPLHNITLSRAGRLEGIASKLAEHHLEHNFKVIASTHLSESDATITPFEYEVGYRLTCELLEAHTEATALIGVNDMTAFGIINALNDNGYLVPKDFSVCGFDNIFSSSISSPKLTTVDHHLAVRAKAAVNVILNKKTMQTSGSDVLLAPVAKIEYDPKLIIRNSTGVAPPQK